MLKTVKINSFVTEMIGEIRTPGMYVMIDHKYDQPYAEYKLF